MSVGYLKQDEEDSDLVLVCPIDGSELLVSEYGGSYVCKANFHEVSPDLAITRETYLKLNPDRSITKLDDPAWKKRNKHSPQYGDPDYTFGHPLNPRTINLIQWRKISDDEKLEAFSALQKENKELRDKLEMETREE